MIADESGESGKIISRPRYADPAEVSDKRRGESLPSAGMCMLIRGNNLFKCLSWTYGRRNMGAGRLVLEDWAATVGLSTVNNQ